MFWGDGTAPSDDALRPLPLGRLCLTHRQGALAKAR